MPKRGPFGFRRPFGIGPFVTDEDTEVALWQLPEYQNIHELIIESAEQCRSSSEYDGNMAIIIFGSYGRGTAETGHSDLDINILTEAIMEEMVGLKLQDSTIDMYECIRETIELQISEISNDKIDEVNIREDILEEPDFFLEHALRTEQPNIAYDLIDENIITLEDVVDSETHFAETI